MKKRTENSQFLFKNSRCGGPWKIFTVGHWSHLFLGWSKIHS